MLILFGADCITLCDKMVLHAVETLYINISLTFAESPKNLPECSLEYGNIASVQ